MTGVQVLVQRGTTPSRPTLMRLMLKLPSGCLTAARTAKATPGLTALMSPISKRTIGTSGVTMMFFSPSLYLTVMTGPLTPVTVAPTVPLVMVLLGAPSQGRKPSPVPRIDSAKMCTSIAFCEPSGYGMAPLPMNAPSLISAIAAFTTDDQRLVGEVELELVALVRLRQHRI